MKPLLAFLITVAAAAPAAAQGGVIGTLTLTDTRGPGTQATVYVFNAERQYITSAGTRIDGTYSVALAPGTYYLIAWKPGYVTQLYSGIPCVAADCFSFSYLGLAGTAVTVGNGFVIADFNLDRGATLSGTLKRAADGAGVANAEVSLFNANTSFIYDSQPTLADGSYSIPGLPPGTYLARTLGGSGSGVFDVLYGGTPCPPVPFTCDITQSALVTISQDASSVTANFLLPPATAAFGTITGHVTVAGTGQPAFDPGFGSSVEAESATDDVVAQGVVMKDGSYTMSAPPGAYYVRTHTFPPSIPSWTDGWYGIGCVSCGITSRSAVTVRAGVAATGIDLTLDDSSGAISGSLTVPGIVANQIVPEVAVFDAQGRFVKSWSHDTTVDSTQTFEWSVNQLAPGTYYVRTISFAQGFETAMVFRGITGGYWIDRLFGAGDCVVLDCLPTRGTPVIVTKGQTTGNIDFALVRGAQLSGKPPDGAFSIQIYDSRGVLLPDRTAADQKLGYIATGLPAGVYYLNSYRPGWGIPGQNYKDMPCDPCAVTSGTPIVLGAGETKTGIDFETLTGGGAIVGSVRSPDPGGQPLSTINIEVYSPSGDLIQSFASVADGTYRIDRLAPGAYYVRTRNTRGYIDAVYGNPSCAGCDPLSGTPVMVNPGSDTTGVNFILSHGAVTVSGTVTDANRVPIGGAYVRLYSSAPAAPAGSATSDAFGHYQVAVPSGSYFAQTDPMSGYTQQIYNGIPCPQGLCPTGSATMVSVTSSPVFDVSFALASCSPPVVAPLSLANAAVGAVYRQTLLAAGGRGVVHFLVSAGTLPPGLSLDPSTGVLSGTPTASGNFTFTVSAVDSLGCAGSRTYTLDVPACTFAGPALLSVPAAGIAVPYPSTGTVILQSCEDPAWRAAIDVTWLHGGRWPFPHVAPDGTVLHSAVVFSVDPNTSPTSRTGHVTYGSHVLTVLQSGAASSAPFGFVDVPHNGDLVSGSIAVSGWALDDVSVSQVQIYRDPVAGEPSQPIFIGNATFVSGSRPDVEAAYPMTPFNTRAGWGYLLLTSMLPNHGNGVFNIYAYATDADGNRTLLGVRTVTGVNLSATAPFGAIDTPDQGGIAAGSAFVNFGWALTPQPKSFPLDGSTIRVLIDGVDVGSVTAYNFFRSDVSNLFTGLRNSSGPVGYRIIDTTALSEGLHTIAWLATDDEGMTTGIGSRYFSVQNSAWQPSLRANFVATPLAFSASDLAQADSMTAVPARVDGIHLGRKAASLEAVPLADDRARVVTMSNLQSLELSLGAGTAVAGGDVSAGERVSPDTCAATYAGYLVVNGELRPLPVGSSLDPGGTFYWHPGPGFFGTYEFVFVRTSCDGTRRRSPVTVVIR